MFQKFTRRIVKNWPLRQQLGFYAFFPIFFTLGAALEFSMINWTVGETNFYRVYKRREIERRLEEELAQKKKVVS